jgi:hypothetical protein
MTLAAVAEALGCSRSDILWTPGKDAPVPSGDIRALPRAERCFAQARIDSRLVGRDDLFF